MKKYNDYENIVYGYLNNYKQFKARSKNLDVEIRFLNEQINNLTDTKIAKYGESIGSTADTFSQSEQYYIRKQNLQDKVNVLTHDKNALDGLIERINNAFNILSTIEYTVLVKRFFEESLWLKIAIDTKYSERSCQRICDNAVTKLTETLFGKYEQGRLFIFVDNYAKTCG